MCSVFTAVHHTESLDSRANSLEFNGNGITAMTTPTLKLRSGDAIPVIGLGMWKVDNPVTATLVQEAIACGYRHVDCACDYGNEAEVGTGLRKAFQSSLCAREDLWITSKLWNTYHRAEHVRMAAEKSLADLQLDYLDLYLIHFPIALQYVPIEHRYPPGWFFDPEVPNPRMHADKVPICDTWGAMEDLVRAGLVKNIGVSNFGCSLLRDLLSYAEVPPAVLQVESHPYLVQEKLLRFCQEQEHGVHGLFAVGCAVLFRIGDGRTRRLAVGSAGRSPSGGTARKNPGTDSAALGRTAAHGCHPQDVQASAFAGESGSV